jgi:hypothetical protein
MFQHLNQRNDESTVEDASYWIHQMAAKEDEAAKVLRRVAARGVPLPFDPK